jgi:hypothetical protein
VREARRVVAEPTLNLHRILAASEKQGRAGVPEAVETDPGNASLFCRWPKDSPADVLLA